MLRGVTPSAEDQGHGCDSHALWGPDMGTEAAASRAPPAPAQPPLLGPLTA